MITNNNSKSSANKIDWGKNSFLNLSFTANFERKIRKQNFEGLKI